MKQLSSYLVLDVSGGDRVSYTYDVINDETGEVEESNVKESFFAVDPTLKRLVEDTRDYIRQHKLAE